MIGKWKVGGVDVSIMILAYDKFWDIIIIFFNLRLIFHVIAILGFTWNIKILKTVNKKHKTRNNYKIRKCRLWYFMG